MDYSRFDAIELSSEEEEEEEEKRLICERRAAHDAVRRAMESRKRGDAREDIFGLGAGHHGEDVVSLRESTRGKTVNARYGCASSFQKRTCRSFPRGFGRRVSTSNCAGRVDTGSPSPSSPWKFGRTNPNVSSTSMGGDWCARL